MPQYVNQERGESRTNPEEKRRSPRSEGDGRRGAEGIPPAAAGAPPFAELSPRAGGQRRRRGRVRSTRRVRPRGRRRTQYPNPVAMSHRKNKTKTTRGSHVLETDGRGLRHPPPARRGMLAHPHRTACPRPRHPGSSIDDRGCYMLAPHRTACPGPRLTATTCPCAPRGPLTAHAPTLTHRQ